MIGFGKAIESTDVQVGSELDETARERYLLMSVLCAVLCGASFAVNSLVMKHYVKAHAFGPIQLNLDGYMVCVVLFLCPGYFIYGPSHYSNADIVKSQASGILSLLGTAAMTKAFKTGKGGPIQAIDSLKCLVPLFLNILFYEQVPTRMQVGGIVSGMVGATIISCKPIANGPSK